MNEPRNAQLRLHSVPVLGQEYRVGDTLPPNMTAADRLTPSCAGCWGRGSPPQHSHYSNSSIPKASCQTEFHFGVCGFFFFFFSVAAAAAVAADLLP
jgi:hypothetical protein